MSPHQCKHKQAPALLLQQYVIPFRKMLLCRYGVTFPVFKKVEVNGEHAHAIMKFIVQQLYGADSSTSFASWNFHKYLIDRRGFPVKQYGSSFDAAVLEADIEAQLLKPAAGQAHQDGVLLTALQ